MINNVAKIKTPDTLSGARNGVFDAISSLKHGSKYIISLKFEYLKDNDGVHSLSFLLVQPDWLHFDTMKLCILDELEEMYTSDLYKSIKLRIREVC
jgi:hypothetical protein